MKADLDIVGLEWNRNFGTLDTIVRRMRAWIKRRGEYEDDVTEAIDHSKKDAFKSILTHFLGEFIQLLLKTVDILISF